uniref:Uncharacterized protein n=1 Tax=Candidatus Methanogaster sp. ANME-2c ERB4 TaxID=2759911 RepID=A0A7G9YHR6_9EURY|nr:hypothetical protein GGGHDLIA_00040 [Methanosarcinales archaeon ANME-2c ERB4]
MHTGVSDVVTVADDVNPVTAGASQSVVSHRQYQILPIENAGEATGRISGGKKTVKRRCERGTGADEVI